MKVSTVTKFSLVVAGLLTPTVAYDENTPCPLPTAPTYEEELDCWSVSVEHDATYCIGGPVCSGHGAKPAGSHCPVKGDAAIRDCNPTLDSYTDSRTCVLPAHASCQIIKTGAWGCVLSNTHEESATPAPTKDESGESTPCPSLTNKNEEMPTPAPTKDEEYPTSAPTVYAATPAPTKEEGGETTPCPSLTSKNEEYPTPAPTKNEEYPTPAPTKREYATPVPTKEYATPAPTKEEYATPAPTKGSATPAPTKEEYATPAPTKYAATPEPTKEESENATPKPTTTSKDEETPTPAPTESESEYATPAPTYSGEGGNSNQGSLSGTAYTVDSQKISTADGTAAATAGGISTGVVAAIAAVAAVVVVVACAALYRQYAKRDANHRDCMVEVATPKDLA